MEHNNPINRTDDPIRLNRYCAACGLGSRRSCDEIIAAGRIFVNGKRVTELGTKIHPRSDFVEFEGKSVIPQRPPTYIAYYKPRGVMVTAFDPEGRPTVYDALKRIGTNPEGLRYIGRLDFNSEGLLLMTNDGELVHALTHPRYHIKKVYEVCIGVRLTTAEIILITEEGIESEGQVLKVGKIKPMPRNEEGFWYLIDLYEGKKRQIRRIFDGLTHTVSRLKRIQFASVKLGELELGTARELTEREVAALKSAGFPVPRKRGA
jgi:pseudouridine synthase